MQGERSVIFSPQATARLNRGTNNIETVAQRHKRFPRGNRTCDWRCAQALDSMKNRLICSCCGYALHLQQAPLQPFPHSQLPPQKLRTLSLLVVRSCMLSELHHFCCARSWGAALTNGRNPTSCRKGASAQRRALAGLCRPGGSARALQPVTCPLVSVGSWLAAVISPRRLRKRCATSGSHSRLPVMGMHTSVRSP